MEDKKWIIYIPEFLPPVEPQKKILDPIAQLKTGEAKNEADLIYIINSVDAVLITLRTMMTRTVIEACPNLKVIGKYGTGLENIDIKAATDMGIPVTNVPGANSNATAELTIGLILAVSRRIQEGKNHIKKGGWRDDTLIGFELMGGTIGIIGYGNIAKLVIRKLQGFEVKKILVFTESKKHEKPEFSNVEFVDFQRLLKESEIVSIHKTLFPQTKGLIGEDELRTMRNTSYLINTSRGGLVQEDALIKALRQGWIAGAALDVHEKEPVNLDNPLLSMSNVVLTPHIGASTLKTRLHSVTIAAQNVADILNGKRPDPKYIVNPEVFKPE
ncbi:MAG: 3-phosphoglycerate dehydrogenase [Deltaproteobacteria bacterium]|nr:3-phosphoglycerate dehydrogenase [Deltaproteobacteria bacterium]MBW2308326.1 3-phosphoglycerate dehydrogenase [Deltaproteobacteria bacterium]